MCSCAGMGRQSSRTTRPDPRPGGYRRGRDSTRPRRSTPVSTRSGPSARSTACPAPSRVPFEWTINPYRGCTHACTYCTQGDTQVLIANWHTFPITDISGPVIASTARCVAGRYRRYTHHRGDRPLHGAQTRVSCHARERNRARLARRPSVPQRSRLEARHRNTIRVLSGVRTSRSTTSSSSLAHSPPGTEKLYLLHARLSLRHRSRRWLSLERAIRAILRSAACRSTISG